MPPPDVRSLDSPSVDTSTRSCSSPDGKEAGVRHFLRTSDRITARNAMLPTTATATRSIRTVVLVDELRLERRRLLLSEPLRVRHPAHDDGAR